MSRWSVQLSRMLGYRITVYRTNLQKSTLLGWSVAIPHRNHLSCSEMIMKSIAVSIQNFLGSCRQFYVAISCFAAESTEDKRDETCRTSSTCYNRESIVSPMRLGCRIVVKDRCQRIYYHHPLDEGIDFWQEHHNINWSIHRHRNHRRWPLIEESRAWVHVNATLWCPEPRLAQQIKQQPRISVRRQSNHVLTYHDASLTSPHSCCSVTL